MINNVIKSNRDRNIEARSIASKTSPNLDNLIPIWNEKHKAIIYFTPDKFINKFNSDPEQAINYWNNKYDNSIVLTKGGITKY
jgi:hypothetical protein